MEPRVRKVVNGAIVLEDRGDLVEGAAVTVWVAATDEPVEVSVEELELIRAGREAASRGELVDARAFLEQLRRGG